MHLEATLVSYSHQELRKRGGFARLTTIPKENMSESEFTGPWAWASGFAKVDFQPELPKCRYQGVCMPHPQDQRVEHCLPQCFRQESRNQ